VAKSMSIHREHCELLGESVHTPSIAAARVKPFIGAQQYNEARRCHRIAGIAKHSWCDLGDERRKQSWADMVDEAGFDSDASTAVPSEGIELDPVFVNDPWRHACTSGLLCSFSSDAAFPAPASLPSVGIDDCLPVPGVTATPYNTSPSRALDAAVQVSFFPQAILSLQKSVDDSNALVKQLEAWSKFSPSSAAACGDVRLTSPESMQGASMQLVNLKFKNVHDELQSIRGTVSQWEGALNNTLALANKAVDVSSQSQSFVKKELLEKVDQIRGELKAETVELSADLSSSVSAAASAAASSSAVATLDLKFSALHTCVRAQLEENARHMDDKIAAHVRSATTEVAELRTKNDYLEKLLKDLQAQIKDTQYTLADRNLMNLGMETAISSDSATTAYGTQLEDTPLDYPAWERAPTVPQLDSTVLLHGLRNEQYNHLFAIVIGSDPARLHVRISPYIAIKVKRCNAMYPAVCPKCGNGVSSSMCFGCGYDPDPPGPRDPYYDSRLQSLAASGSSFDAASCSTLPCPMMPHASAFA